VINLDIQDKIAQMCMIGIDSKEDIPKVLKLITDYHIGGVIIYRNNYDNYKEMLNLINDLKKANQMNPHPLFIAIDQEGGRVNRLPNEFHNLYNAYKLGSTNDLDIIKEAGSITGEILFKSGINMDLAPVLDIKNSKDNHAIGNRCFSSSADLVAKYGLTYMDALNNQNIISVVKHFPGHGAIKTDSHKFIPIIKDFSLVKSIHTYPFMKSIKHHADVIMVGHILIKKITGFYPASISDKFIKPLLRKEMRYKGLIMTDELSMRSVRYLYGRKRSISLAFKAGNNIICYKYYPNIERDMILHINKMVNKGKIKTKDIDYSYEKIVNIKEKYQLNNEIIRKNISISKINKKIDDLNKLVDSHYNVTKNW
jgi:beta-N-acetylhexosaminidase